MRGMPEGGEGDTCRGSTPYQAAVERRHPCRGEPDGALQAVPFRDHGAGGRQVGTPQVRGRGGGKSHCPAPRVAGGGYRVKNRAFKWGI